MTKASVFTVPVLSDSSQYYSHTCEGGHVELSSTRKQALPKDNVICCITQSIIAMGEDLSYMHIINHGLYGSGSWTNAHLSELTYLQSQNMRGVKEKKTLCQWYRRLPRLTVIIIFALSFQYRDVDRAYRGVSWSAGALFSLSKSLQQKSRKFWRY